MNKQGSIGYGAELVYQVGIANVMLDGQRVYQGDYRGAEMIVMGMLMAGLPVGVYHCDKPGDVKLFEASWTVGCGDLWSDKKHPPIACA